MRLLYCDESNLAEKSGDCLIYGGISFDAATSREFSTEIERIRRSMGVKRDYKLKFNPGPDGMPHDKFIALKQAIMECAAKFGAQLIVYSILHDIATNPDDARRNGINTVCYHFDCMLHRSKEPGLALIDRFNDAGNRIDGHLVEKFTVGLTGMPYSHELRLDNIVGFHYSALGQSHFPSVVDVTLGSLRFALNACTRKEEKHYETAQRLLEIINPMFFREGAQKKVPEIAFMLSPKNVKTQKYRDIYLSIQEFLAKSGIDLSQKI